MGSRADGTPGLLAPRWPLADGAIKHPRRDAVGRRRPERRLTGPRRAATLANGPAGYRTHGHGGTGCMCADAGLPGAPEVTGPAAAAASAGRPGRRATW